MTAAHDQFTAFLQCALKDANTYRAEAGFFQGFVSDTHYVAGSTANALANTAAQIKSQVPLGRFGEAKEIAATVLHLSATESAYIVGTEIIVDGGMSQL